MSEHSICLMPSLILLKLFTSDQPLVSLSLDFIILFDAQDPLRTIDGENIGHTSDETPLTATIVFS